MNKALIIIAFLMIGVGTNSNLIAGGGHKGSSHHGSRHHDHGWHRGRIGFGIGLGIGPSYYDCDPRFDLDCPYWD